MAISEKKIASSFLAAVTIASSMLTASVTSFAEEVEKISDVSESNAEGNYLIYVDPAEETCM